MFRFLFGVRHSSYNQHVAELALLLFCLISCLLTEEFYLFTFILIYAFGFISTTSLCFLLTSHFLFFPLLSCLLLDDKGFFIFLFPPLLFILFFPLQILSPPPFDSHRTWKVSGLILHLYQLLIVCLSASFMYGKYTEMSMFIRTVFFNGFSQSKHTCVTRGPIKKQNIPSTEGPIMFPLSLPLPFLSLVTLCLSYHRPALPILNSM